MQDIKTKQIFSLSQQLIYKTIKTIFLRLIGFWSRNLETLWGLIVTGLCQARPSKSKLFCRSKVLRKLNGPKTNIKIENWPKKGETVVNCAFLHSKTQILRNLWKLLRDRAVAWSQLLEALHELTTYNAG